MHLPSSARFFLYSNQLASDESELSTTPPANCTLPVPGPTSPELSILSRSASSTSKSNVSNSSAKGGEGG